MKINQLEVFLLKDRKEMGQKAACDTKKAIDEILKTKEEVNIIFAAAPSQNEFLTELAQDKSIPWNKINAFHMDEYLDLPPEAPQRFGNFLKRNLFENVPLKAVYYINPMANKKEEIERYSALIKSKGIDIVCMGIGENCHIAFNDPHIADFNDPEIMKIVDLDDRCRQQQVNDGCFSEISKVPTKAFTLTIPVLISAPYTFCIVPAQSKAEAVFNTLYRDISESYPSTILRNKENAKLYIEPQSASLILK